MIMHHGRCAAILIILAATAVPAASQTPLPPREAVFGINDDEFLIGGWNVPRVGSASIDDAISRTRGARQIVEWATRLGLGLVRLPLWVGYDPLDQGRYQFLSALIDTSARLAPGLRYLIQGIPPLDAAALGREARFYFVPDSVPYRDWQSRFLHLRGGYARELPASDELIDRTNTPFEQVYDPRSATPGSVIADSLVMGWQPSMTNWWPVVLSDGRVVDQPPHTIMRRNAGLTSFWMSSAGPPTDNPVLTLALRGHLFAPPAAGDTHALLEIDVLYDVAPGEHVALKRGGIERAVDFRSELCTTFVVRIADLAPTERRPSLDQVQEARFHYDASRCNAVLGGPLAPGSTSRRLGLRVRYVGSERVALRSIAIRDGRADSVLSFDKPYEPWILRDLTGVLSVTSGDGTPRLRPTIVSFTAGVEQNPLQASALDSVNTWIGRMLMGPDPYNDGRRDTVTAWTEGAFDGVIHQTARLPAVVAEYGFGSDARDEWRGSVFGLPGRLPSIREHNGGRFSVPELEVSTQGIEAYETALQRLSFRQHHPDYPASFPEQLRFQLSHSAAVARDMGRRLISVPFLSSMLRVNRDQDGRPVPGVITMDRLLEANDLHALVGISLAHGATGIFWQILTTETNFVDTFAVVDGQPVWHGRFDDFGAAGGPFTSDTLLDWTPSFRLSSPDLFDRGYRTGPTRVIIDSMYLGWGQRRRAMQEIHAWLRRVGPELVKLRWRDAYAAHAAVPMPYRVPHYSDGRWIDVLDTLPARPLPATEIITTVRTRPRPGEPLDPPERTYVELGLFDAVNASGDADRDTHHVMVTNRRVFSRPDDVDPRSARGRLMDSLAETRTIVLKLNLPPTAGRSRVRVREVAPDTAPLPGSTARRRPLDALVARDGEVELALGPGRSALLRITYE